jgi:hypothetical protein
MTTCAYPGCDEDALAGRMYCSVHLNSYDNDDVPALRKRENPDRERREQKQDDDDDN